MKLRCGASEPGSRLSDVLELTPSWHGQHAPPSRLHDRELGAPDSELQEHLDLPGVRVEIQLVQPALCLRRPLLQKARQARRLKPKGGACSGHPIDLVLLRQSTCALAALDRKDSTG